MSRGLSTTLKTALANTVVQYITLVKLNYSTALCYNDSPRSVDYGGDIYLPGRILGLSEVDEVFRLEVQQYSIAITGADRYAMDVIINSGYARKSVTIYKFFYDSNMQLLGLSQTFDGVIIGDAVSEDPDKGYSTINIKIANHWYDFERKNGRSTSDDSQKIYFPTDEGLSFTKPIIGFMDYNDFGRQ